jgi:hypothetical protein
MAVRAGEFDCGVTEGMNETDIDPVTGLPDPFRTARRGLIEEMAINLDDEAV